MATPLVLVSCRNFVGGYDLTGYNNKLEVTSEVEDKDVTTFLPASDPDCGWKKVKGGIASAKMVGGGHWEGALDEAAWSALGSVVPHSAFAADANEGAVGYFTSALSRSYQFLGPVGDVAAWQVNDDSAWPMVRGFSLEAPGTARSTTGTGTPVQVGAVPAGKYLYAALHVLSVTGTGGPSIAVKIQSDAAVGFTTPIDQITFSTATAIGGQIARVAGPITDDWFRVSHTITGVGPSCLYVAVVGISP
jgi:hypothetical protein